MNASQILAAITPVIEALEELGVPYHIGGSVASSIYGILRATIDADLIADLRLEHVRPLVIRLQTDYYIDEDMIWDAIKRRSSFNVIHLDTMLKVDVYIPKSRPVRSGRTTESAAGSIARGNTTIERCIARRHDFKQTRMVQDGW